MNIGFLQSSIAPLPAGADRHDRYSGTGENQHHHILKESLMNVSIPHRYNLHKSQAFSQGLSSAQAEKLESPRFLNHHSKNTMLLGFKKERESKSFSTLVAPPKKGTPNSVTMYPHPSQRQEDSSNKAMGLHHAGRSSQQRQKSTINYSFPNLPLSIDEEEETAATTRTTKAIPISVESMKRTASELQLLEDEAMADYRDYCMYTRIVNGMAERRSWTELPSQDGAIRNIIQTRHRPVVDEDFYNGLLESRGPDIFLPDPAENDGVFAMDDL